MAWRFSHCDPKPFAAQTLRRNSRTQFASAGSFASRFTVVPANFWKSTAATTKSCAPEFLHLPRSAVNTNSLLPSATPSL
jgi:hypothetical protein